MVTTDKVYENQEWDHSYRECDRLGGHDPYSASKAAAEIAIESWRRSFCGKEPHQNMNIAIATARAGNVIGGGDWAEDRIMPDAIRALKLKKKLNTQSERTRSGNTYWKKWVPNFGKNNSNLTGGDTRNKKVLCAKHLISFHN